MQASESPFESYKSKRILFFANLIYSSVSGPKALKNRVCVLPYSIVVKSYRTFSILDKKNVEWSYKYRSRRTNISKEKIRRHVFVVYMLTSDCLNLKANEQIPFEFQLFKVSPPSEKIDSRKQC